MMKFCGPLALLPLFLLLFACSLSRPWPPVGQQEPVAAAWKPTADSISPPNYLYQTRFRKAVPYPLRAAGRPTAQLLYQCPPRAAVYVLSQSSNSYTRVAVNGRVGYVVSGWLADIR